MSFAVNTKCKICGRWFVSPMGEGGKKLREVCDDCTTVVAARAVMIVLEREGVNLPKRVQRRAHIEAEIAKALKRQVFGSYEK